MTAATRRRAAANRRRVAEHKARRGAGRACCTVEYDTDMLNAAVRRGYLDNFETNTKKT
jgi:hypothetical protein